MIAGGVCGELTVIVNNGTFKKMYVHIFGSDSDCMGKSKPVGIFVFC